MRTFLRAHWKVLVAIVLLVVLGLFTVTPGAAVSEPALALRLRAHVGAMASVEPDSAAPARLAEAARYIEEVLQEEGYTVRRQAYQAGGRKVRDIEVSVANLAPHGKPARIFIVGAHYDAAPPILADAASGTGTAAVLELARLLKDLRPSLGTEVKFVFFVDGEAPWLGGANARAPHADGLGIERAPAPETAGWYTQRRHGGRPAGMDGADPGAGYLGGSNFIAYVGTLASSRRVQEALSAFRPVADFPAHGLAAPAYVQGVTFSHHGTGEHPGYPAIMITDTGFMRYPYYRTTAADSVEDALDRLDYDSTARVVRGLARTITVLAAGAQG
jgi:hypothetical protein